MNSIKIDFTQSLYKSADGHREDVRLLNCFCASGPSGNFLEPVPGSSSAASVAPGYGTGCRGAFRASTGPQEDGFKGTCYFVFGDSVFRYTRRGTVVKVGSFNSSNVSGSCTFAENQAQTSSDAWIYVCDQQTIYKFSAKASDANVQASWQELGNLPHVPDGDLQAIPSYITWSDYRLIMAVKGSNAWFYSETGTDDFKETNVYFGESSADRTVRVQGFAGNVWSFGTSSYDIFSRTGNRQNPYSNPKSASGNIGLASAESLAIVDDAMFWLGSGESASNGVYMADRTGSIKRISDQGVEQQLKAWEYQDSAYGTAYVERGQIFYSLTSFADCSTVVYNASTGLWHQASSSVNGRESFWDVSYCIAGYEPGQILFGPRSQNVIAAFSRSSMVDYAGRPITRIWQSPAMAANMKRFRFVRMAIDVETGTSESYNRDSSIWVQLSGDGGRTWRERVDRTLGARGEYGRTVQVVGGMLTRSMCIRLGTSDLAPLRIYGLKLDIEEMAR